MSESTVIAVVTIICTMITTSVGLIVRSGVIALTKTVGDQTLELAKLHQLITSQNATIHQQEVQIHDVANQKVLDNKKPPSS